MLKVEVVNMNSKKYDLDMSDFNKIGKGALIALGGAFLAYVSDVVPMVDWGVYQGLVVALCSVLVNVGLKFLNGKK